MHTPHRVLNRSDQLEFLLFDRDPAEKPKKIKKFQVKVAGRPPDPVETQPPWTDEDIVHIKYAFLTDSLAVLSDNRSSAKHRSEIVDWMKITAKQTPFSFYDCCRSSGYDHGQIRDEVRYLFPDFFR